MIFVKIGNIFRIRTLPPAAGLGAGPQTDLSGARNGNDAFRKGATGFPDDSGSGRGHGAGTTAGKNHPAAAGDGATADGDDAAADESDSVTAKNDTTAA